MMTGFAELERAILNPLYQGKYAEVKWENVFVLVQPRSTGEWTVQFYKPERYMIVEKEVIMPNGVETIEFIHEAMVHLEKNEAFDWNILKLYANPFIIVRDPMQNGRYTREDYKTTSYNSFRNYMEILQYDESVQEFINGGMKYSKVIERLREYGLERG